MDRLSAQEKNLWFKVCMVQSDVVDRLVHEIQFSHAKSQ